jgi:hypothetical protein
MVNWLGGLISYVSHHLFDDAMWCACILTPGQVKEELDSNADFLKPYSIKANGDASAAAP